MLACRKIPSSSNPSVGQHIEKSSTSRRPSVSPPNLKTSGASPLDPAAFPMLNRSMAFITSSKLGGPERPGLPADLGGMFGQLGKSSFSHSDRRLKSSAKCLAN